MERAAQACFSWITENYPAAKQYTIFCGKGNNGGDGLALARLLSIAGCNIQLHILEFGFPGTQDFQQNLARVHTCSSIQIQYIQHESHIYPICPGSIVVDALFGSGLNRKLEGLSAAVVETINQTNNPIIALDVPSGLFCDQSAEGFPIVRATHTLSFSAKLAFYVGESKPFIGHLHLLEIGLSHDFEQTNQARFELLSKEKIHSTVKPRHLFTHKGNYGHGLLIAGSPGKMGACALAARGALRSGLGLLTCFIPASENTIIQTSVPEAMSMTDFINPAFLMEAEQLSIFHSIAIGPGFGIENDQKNKLELLLNSYKKPILFDADALTLLSKHPSLLDKIPPYSILTPHPGEFKRLFGETKDSFDKIELAIKKSKELNVIIVLKGQHTLITSPQEPFYINSTGNPGMARGGTGDVLTGVILGLLAQGYSSIEASVIGVYLHGRAGDIAAANYTQYGMTTSDLIDSLGAAWKELL